MIRKTAAPKCRTSKTAIETTMINQKRKLLRNPVPYFLKILELSALVSLKMNTGNIRAESKQFGRFAPAGVDCSCLFSAWSLGGNQDSE